MDLGRRSMQEMRRQNAVVLYGLVDSDLEDVDARELDAITHSLQTFLTVEYAGVHILDGSLQVTLAATGQRPAPPVLRQDSMCAAVLDEQGDASVLEVPDTAQAPFLHDNPFVDGERSHIRFYAATPLRTSAGLVLGTLCVTGREPRTLDESERHLLLHLGYAVVHVLDRHRRRHQPDVPGFVG